MGECSPRQMDPIHGVLLGVQLGTAPNPDQWVYQEDRYMSPTLQVNGMV